MISRGAREVIRFGFRRNQCFVYCALTEQRHWCVDSMHGLDVLKRTNVGPGIEVCAVLISHFTSV